MIESMLEPHLRSAGATQSQVGITFLILGGVYMVTTPIAGYVSLNSEEKILTPLPLYVVKWPFLRGQKTTQKTCKIHYLFTN